MADSLPCGGIRCDPASVATAVGRLRAEGAHVIFVPLGYAAQNKEQTKRNERLNRFIYGIAVAYRGANTARRPSYPTPTG